MADQSHPIPDNLAFELTVQLPGPRIFQEGLRIPPMRLYDRGEPVDAVFEIIERNVRVPRQVLGDVRAQLAACAAGEKGLLDLISRYGAERFRDRAQRDREPRARCSRRSVPRLTARR